MFFRRKLALARQLLGFCVMAITASSSNVSAADSREVLVVGIAGGTGSGKTTFAKASVDRLKSEFGDEVILISHDSYYKVLSHLTEEERAVVNFDHPDALESSLLRDHLAALKVGWSVVIPEYDFTTHSRVEIEEEALEIKTVHPKKIIIVEGILIFAAEELDGFFDIKIFVNTHEELRYARRKARDMAERGRTAESIDSQIAATVKPMHDAHVEPCKNNVDYVISGQGDTAADVAMLVNVIKEKLAGFV